MKTSRAIVAALLIAAAALPGFSAGASRAGGLRVGILGSGGLSTAAGSLLDARAADLAAMGGSSIAAPGSVHALPFPSWTAGAFVETDLLSWLALRVEPRVSATGAAFLAATDAGVAFARYGVSLRTLLVDVLLEGRLRLGPGYLTGAAGAFPAVVVGPVVVPEQYASVATTAVITQSLLGSLFLGATAGLGYTLPIGRLDLSLEARADVGLTSACTEAGAGLYPLSLSLLAGVGFSLGGRP